jgi:superfamily II DNA or RNA helicase
MKKRVEILRSGNRIVISPTTPRMVALLAPALSYTERRYYEGAERRRRQNANLSLAESIEWQCFAIDHKNRLASSVGFTERILGVLTNEGYRVSLRWATKAEATHQEERNRTVYAPNWERVDRFVKEDGFKFRKGQRSALDLLINHTYGRIDCPTGWGKGTFIVLAAMLFTKAKIDVVVDSVEVAHTRLYPALAMNLPSVGLVGGGVRKKGFRVMCYTADSLHHGRKSDADFLFVDEGHQACADRYASSIGDYDQARVWMLSASWDMRLDGKDRRAEAMAGPIRLSVSYEEAERAGMVSPIEIRWENVIMDVNPCTGETDRTEKKRLGIWSNDYRNQKIAEVARRYGDDKQVLITVETVEHGLRLKKLLPEFKFVFGHDKKDESEIDRYLEINEDFRPMTLQRRRKLTKRFESGKLKKAIATTVWNVGVDFVHLDVLIRGEGSASKINDVQIPGRNSRLSVKKKKGKRVRKVGIVHDFRDQFDRGFNRRAKGREASYTRMKWKQINPSRSKLKRAMNMEPED